MDAGFIIENTVIFTESGTIQEHTDGHHANSAIQEHTDTTGHRFTQDSLSILQKEPFYHCRQPIHTPERTFLPLQKTERSSSNSQQKSQPQ